MARRILAFVISGILALATLFAADPPPISTPNTPTDDSPAAVAAAKRMGMANAQRDVQAGRLRIVYPMEGSFILGPYGLFDPDTGYMRYPVDACLAGTAFDAEVEAYNQVMHDWHTKHK